MRFLYNLHLSRSTLIFLLYLVTAFNLYTVLTQRATEQTALLNGWMMSPIYQGGPFLSNNITGCDGIWDCAKMVCERTTYFEQNDTQHYTYMLLDAITVGQCKPYSWSWITDPLYKYGLASIIVLLIGVGIELIRPLVTMCSFNIDEYANKDDLTKWIAFGMMILARLCLLTAYGLGYYWYYFIAGLMGDRAPKILQITDLIRSAVLIFLNLWTIIPVEQVSTYTSI